MKVFAQYCFSDLHDRDIQYCMAMMSDIILYCYVHVLNTRCLYNINFVCMYIAPPQIEQTTLRNSIIAEGESASFTCSAKGYPPPIVIWLLNETRVQPQDRGILVYENSSQSGPYNVTMSELMITAARQKLNVEVKCLARSTNTVIDLPDDIESAQLVVLGKLTFHGFGTCPD